MSVRRVIAYLSLFLLLEVGLHYWQGSLLSGDTLLKEDRIIDSAIAVENLYSEISIVKSELDIIRSQLHKSNLPVDEKPFPSVQANFDHLSDRLDNLEAEIDTFLGFNEAVGYSSERISSISENMVSLRSGDDTNSEHVNDIEEKFHTDSSSNDGSRIDRENVIQVFDDPELEGMSPSEVSCTDNFCRVTYSNETTHASAATIAENELILKLSEYFEQDVVVHHGSTRNGLYTLYVEILQ